MKRAAAGATLLSLGAALLSAVCLALAGPVRPVFAAWGKVQIGVYFDALSAVMLVLVSFLGAVVTRYALNYLQGDARQGSFLKWLCVTVGAVLTLIVSGNLVMFTGAWIADFAEFEQVTHVLQRPSRRSGGGA